MMISSLLSSLSLSLSLCLYDDHSGCRGCPRAGQKQQAQLADRSAALKIGATIPPRFCFYLFNFISYFFSFGFVSFGFIWFRLVWPPWQAGTLSQILDDR
jgi:hypothetical protein